MLRRMVVTGTGVGVGAGRIGVEAAQLGAGRGQAERVRGRQRCRCAGIGDVGVVILDLRELSGDGVVLGCLGAVVVGGVGVELGGGDWKWLYYMTSEIVNRDF